MTRCTSTASYREIREDGTELSQSEKILEIISIGGTFSLQEIMAIYRGKYGNIELSSVSARCNKLKEEGKIIEGKTRKCAVSGKTINELKLNTCTHDRYRTDDYMCHPKALKDENIAWVGMVVTHCKDCGTDIEFARRAPALSAAEYLRKIGVDHGQNKRRRKRG